MIIAVASGKGGTGKTTVAVSLAVMLSRRGSCVYADCDVEEPNGLLFLNPVVTKTSLSTVPVPIVDTDRCTGCGKCQAICQFNAIIVLAGKPLMFPELCHACGGCVYVCPGHAISEQPRTTGAITMGAAKDLLFVQGELTVGQAQSPPLIREVKRNIPPADVTIIDCPPGTSCPVIAAIDGADYVLLVTEPTPFGLHDLELAVEVVETLGIQYGVVINRYGPDALETESFCQIRGIPILATIADDERIARAYSKGNIIIEALPEYEEPFYHLIYQLEQTTRTDAT